ncbi:MAG: protein RodZ [Verrucomicrobia bacterium]|jgi:cytoskeleton protein RodZ|nr:MAG: protein RodZ [Verrucomicrobiota bacterium]
MQSIGERLEEARKKKGISLREAAEATKIRGDYLSQFENNRFDINLTEIYVRGFLRNYATYLKLSGDKILNDYASLGRGDGRPRQPSREIYGRMDVSIASAEDRGEGAAPEEIAAPQVAHRQPAVSRGSNVSAGPAIDPALLFKFGKWIAGGVIVLLILWAVTAIISGTKSDGVAHSPSAALPKPAVVAPVVAKTITLVALDVVRVTVVARNDDDSEGAEIFRGTLARGQTQEIPWPGPGSLYIKANAGENLQIEYKGKRYGSQFTGNNRAKM